MTDQTFIKILVQCEQVLLKEMVEREAGNGIEITKEVIAAGTEIEMAMIGRDTEAEVENGNESARRKEGETGTVTMITIELENVIVTEDGKCTSGIWKF